MRLNMPLYDLKCKVCDNVFEEILSINSENPKCKKCNGETEKLISIFSGVVKGSEHRSLDCIVGADAEKRWLAHEKRHNERIKRSK
jgi:putative FmdB family regulatory protein